MPFDLSTAKPIGGFDPSTAKPVEQNVPRETMPTQDISVATNVSSGLNEGLANALGLPVDAVTSAINQAAVNFGYNAPIKDPVGGSAFFQNVLENLGMIGGQPESKVGQIVRRVSREIGSAVVPGVGMASKATAPAKFLAGELALAGIGGGAAGAVEQADGGPVAQMAAQVAAPLATTGLVTGAQAATRGVMRGRTPRTVQETIENFSEFGGFPSVGQATKSRAMQNFETLVSKGPGGGTPFFNKATETTNKIQARINQIADDLSKRATPETAGRAIKGGIEKFVGDFKGKANILYNKLDDAIPKETKISVSNTQAMLDDLAAPIAGAEKTSTRLLNPIIRQMQQDLTEDAADGTLPYAALRALRSRVGEKLTNPDLISDVPKAQLKRLYGAISEDLKAAAGDAGAMEAWKRADNYWKAGLGRVDDFLEPLAKKVQPEDIFMNVTRGREGATKIRAVMKSLKPQEKEMVASAVLRRMGKAIASQQDELSDVFSTETFLTNWNKMSPQARSVLFSGSNKLDQYAKNIDQIAKATNTIREGTKALVNPSGTASQFSNIFTMGLASGAAAFEPKLAAIAGMAFVSNNATARLMTSPKFVRFLADSTRVPVERLPNLVTRLTSEIQNEPQLQQDVQEYIQGLQQ